MRHIVPFKPFRNRYHAWFMAHAASVQSEPAAGLAGYGAGSFVVIGTEEEFPMADIRNKSRLIKQRGDKIERV